MRTILNKDDLKRFETNEFYKIDEVIDWFIESKNKGANYIDFTGYRNVVKCRILNISPDDDLIMNDTDVV